MKTGYRIGRSLQIQESQLLKLEAEYCAAKRRKKWCKLGSSADASIGRMLNDLRTECANFRATRLTKTQLHTIVRNYCAEHQIPKPGAYGNFCSFLNGENKGSKPETISKWVDIGRVALNVILTGAGDGQLANDDSGQQVVDRIKHYFFPATTEKLLLGQTDFRKTWFFAPRLNEFSNPVNGREVWSELRRLSWLKLNSDLQIKIYRVACGQPFLQFSSDQNQLTKSGSLTMESMVAGVDVHYIFPDDKNNPAFTSAHEFAEAIRSSPNSKEIVQRLSLHPISFEFLSKEARNGEFFSKLLSYSLYDINQSYSDSTLLIMRNFEFGTSAFVPSEDELTTFREWCQSACGS